MTDQASELSPAPAAASAPERRLADCPDWRYLIRELRDLYRLGMAGGSAKIRGHQHQVRGAIGRLLDANPVIVPRKAEEKPVTAHLRRALNNGKLENTQSVVRSIEAVAPNLTWLYGYQKVPRGLSQKYA
ncbi:MAG: dimethylsulfonioproprionate lyase family protein, partial [Pseudomonadota bacterium]